MSDTLSDAEFDDLVRTVAKMRQISLDEAKEFLVKAGARNMSAADAEKTLAVTPQPQ